MGRLSDTDRSTARARAMDEREWDKVMEWGLWDRASGFRTFGGGGIAKASGRGLERATGARRIETREKGRTILTRIGFEGVRNGD